MLTSLSNDIDTVKADLETELTSKIQRVNPVNWFDLASITSGILSVDGTVTASDSHFHTDYIPVSAGDVVGYYRDGNYAQIYAYKLTAYNESKVAQSDAGKNSSTKNPYTVPDGIEYVRITFLNTTISASRVIITKNGAPTSYSDYFEPYDAYLEDFISTSSKTALNKIKNNALTTSDLANRYACALPKGVTVYMTIGLPESWYNKNMVTPEGTYIRVNAGTSHLNVYNDYVQFLCTTASEGVNGFKWFWYDNMLTLLDSEEGASGVGRPRKVRAENLSDVSLLAIGDSTVDQDVLTSTLLSHFTAQGHTLTLLGTRGDNTEINKNEGRAGWKATDYLTDKAYDGITNPFYNPTTETFDFSYYMTNQGYTAPDFVVIQLGINDLYSNDYDAIPTAWSAVETMIDSILAYNSGIKVILNLPTTPNSDQSEHSVFEPLYRNRVVTYNAYAMSQVVSKYSHASVRCSYCHLILDPATDIRDNVHPTAGGYEKMALEVVNQINNWLVN